MTSAFGIEHVSKAVRGVNPFVKPKTAGLMDEVFTAHHKKIADSYRQVTLGKPKPAAAPTPKKPKSKKPKTPSKTKSAAVGLATGAAGGTAIAGGGLAYQKAKQKKKVVKSAFGVEHQVSKLAMKASQVAVKTKKSGVVHKPKGKLKRIGVGAVNASHQFGGAGPTPLTVAARSVTPLRHLAHG